MVGTTEYHLRFNQDDLAAAEDDLMMGYVFFLDTKYLSFRVYRTLIHRGLKIKKENGDLVQAYPANAEGLNRAGELYQIYMKNGGDILKLRDAMKQALDMWPWRPPETKQDEKGEPQKNLPADG